MNYTEYQDLTPNDHIENGDEYINALKWALNNKKIKNIALAGPYGSGKSSIIESFLKSQNSSDKIKQKYSIKEQIVNPRLYIKKKFTKREHLNISLATFIEGHLQTTESAKIELSPAEIEEGILKQLFYKVEPSKIPQSRYRKLKVKRKATVYLKVLFLIILSVLMCAIFRPDIYESAINSIEVFANGSKFETILTHVLPLILFLLISALISYIYYNLTIASTIRVSEIKLPADTTIKKESDDIGTIFNKNLDEIVYFFEATNYRIVFFEDLDRLGDTKVFVHLRELNNLLNNDDAIKNKPVVFVYAVRDDLFSDEDRTKFFDFIIPVIPVINSTNSGEVLLKRLHDARSHGIIHDISDGFVLDVAPYISDMRILINIYNEFVVYKKILKVSQELDLFDEQILALIIFKNLYPSDFADIQDEKGIIKEAFQNKEKFVENQRDILQDKIDEINEKIERTNTDALQSLSEIKTVMLCALAEWKGIASQVGTKNIGTNFSKKLTAKDILNDEFDLASLNSNGYNYINYLSFSDGKSMPLPVKDFDCIIAPYIERALTRKKLCDKGMGYLQSEIGRLQEKQRRLSSLTLKELIAEYPDSVIINTQNKFLIFLLRRGYIDEKYSSYINYFKGTTITNNDMNFILSVKNREAKPFTYRLSKTEEVLKRLQNYEFEQKEVYNFDLLDQMLSQNSSAEKLTIMIKQLSDESEVSWNFIDEFVDETIHQDQFIKLLSKRWNRMWLNITLNKTLSYDRQIYYLVTLIRVLTPQELSLQNEDGSLVDFFEGHADILLRLERAGCNNLKVIVEELNLTFHCLNMDDVSSELQSFIFEGHYYELTWPMVQNIVSFKDKSLLIKLKEQPYSTILSLNYKPLLEDVHKNISTYTREIILAQETICDSTEDIISLLELLIESPELCVDLIVKEQFRLDFLEQCCGDLVNQHADTVKKIWTTLLVEEKISPSWGNVLVFAEDFGFENELRDYITNNVDLLLSTNDDHLPDSFIAEFIRTDFTEEVKRKVLSVFRMVDFSLEIEELDKATLKILIDYCYFAFSASKFSKIYEIDAELAVEFIMHNQQDFIDGFAEIKMTPDLFELVLLNEKLNFAIRQELFEKYATDFMTAELANNMNQEYLGLHITTSIFRAAWNYLDKRGKETLMYLNLCILESNDFESCFADLGDEYSEFTNRSNRHDVILSISEEHWDLAKRLKSVGYITSYHPEDDAILDIIKSGSSEGQIRYRIKQVSNRSE